MTSTRGLLCGALIVILLAPGCKTRGTIELELGFATVCEASSAWSVYAVRDGTCDACECGNCFAA
jgi:hypothetical protein